MLFLIRNNVTVVVAIYDQKITFELIRIVCTVRGTITAKTWVFFKDIIIHRILKVVQEPRIMSYVLCFKEKNYIIYIYTSYNVLS